MEKNTEKIEKKKGPGRGGARPGAGRKKGSTEFITIDGLLEELRTQAGGKPYEALLVEDFLQARGRNDTQLTVKYHNLILNKVMGTINKVEITDSQENIESKSIAFAEALAKFTGIKTDK
jgi:hypothetical protein